MGRIQTDEQLKSENAEIDYANAQLEAQKNELLAMVDELSFLQSRLAESEAALRNAQQIARLGSWTFDPATGLMNFSDEMFRLFGKHPENHAVSYSDLMEWIHTEDRATLDRRVRDALATGRDFELELRVSRDGRMKRTVLSRGHCRKSRDGKGTLLIGTLQDITERKRSEEALFKANEKLNMLSSITRHDVLNKLTALQGFLELSQIYAGDNQNLLHYVGKGLEITSAIQGQIEFTRFYQDIGIQAPEWQDLPGIIDSAAGQLKPDGISIGNRIRSVEIFADPLIGKVFYNLMENSLRHGERVRSMAFSATECDQGMVVTYEDDGAGISDEDKKRLFTKGFGKHTGLGLFLSREILAITGIGIRENGVFGKGVRFEIMVPKGMYRFP